MRLNQQQLQQYDRDGFLIFPGLITQPEVEALRRETTRLANVDAPIIKRERNGAVRTIFRVHEQEGATASPEFRALSRIPRLLTPAMQIVRDEALYIFHTKINLKPAIEGTIWAWHQDFGTWQRDGLPSSNVTTALVMLDAAEEIGGALYFVPGSHRQGTLEHVEDHTVGALNQYSVRRDLLTATLEAHKPVPVIGPAGTVALFHSNIVHGSGHNMSARDRRQLYIVYNPIANKPRLVEKPRPDHVCSTNFEALHGMGDLAILDAERVKGGTALHTT
jgi:ectoine hydroxylase